MKRCAAITISLALAWAAPAPAIAQSNGAAAEALFREGKKLYEAQDYKHACEKLAESQRLDPASGTLLALAICHEAEGRLATAWAEYTDVVSQLKREERADREQAAKDRATALEGKLSMLTVVVPDALGSLPGLEVKRDGALIGSASWGTPVPVDAGEHVIEVKAQGKKTWNTTIVVGASADRKTVNVAQLEDDPAAATQPPTGPAAPVTADAQTTVDTGKKSQLRTAAIVTAGAGAVGIIVGSIFGLRAISKNNESKDNCDGDYCWPDGKTARNDARTAGNVSTVAFIAGGALLGSGAAIWFLSKPSTSTVEGSVRAGASLVDGQPGLLVRGTF